MKNIMFRFVLVSAVFLMSFIALPFGVYAENEDPGMVTGEIQNAATGPEVLQDPADAADASGDKGNIKVMSLLDIINKGGIVGYLIILLSIVSLGLILDYSLTIRKVKILPPEDVSALKEMIEKGQFHEMNKMDNAHSSFLCKVTLAGLKEVQLGYGAMIKAMEDTSEALTSGIARKIEHLNVIGNISPMMGLLGTVIGMLRCFNEIANVAGAIEPKQLAGGIFEALITTCLGLIVAIPSLYCYAVFRNRIDEFTCEASLAAESLVSSFKDK
ncbi:MAG: MotA/TolQ/ExbB proton channel family protein [Proteobacteria bacterium]|nr:MotA/TolQ/ExbB proton channel family protein [Pseudomonadota bacterium]MBU4318559.1 MotA/TolQ/ExbB proton channel family protein [Pseudomonadota bacterium]MBU4470386.1 MotA/TolQ/ExbB proton channel family protein [Pseudomonadota bacterium]MCG2753921.1 MotA/TolQ/ExbB proton channel family protein [Desulfobacteraceae bacterium]